MEGSDDVGKREKSLALKKRQANQDKTPQREPTEEEESLVHQALSPSCKDIFLKCKEYLASVKDELAQMKLPGTPQELYKQSLVSIGDHIASVVKAFSNKEEMQTWKKNLWKYSSCFTNLDDRKLHKLYKYAVKNEDERFQDAYEEWTPQAPGDPDVSGGNYNMDQLYKVWGLQRNCKDARSQGEESYEIPHSPARSQAEKQEMRSVDTPEFKKKKTEGQEAATNRDYKRPTLPSKALSYGSFYFPYNDPSLPHYMRSPLFRSDFNNDKICLKDYMYAKAGQFTPNRDVYKSQSGRGPGSYQNHPSAIDKIMGKRDLWEGMS
ncbi:uncharacterized protein C17orf64 homolog [Rhinatrema bivittatum]|uniref:uncharacterized protein C17orf64 homolog n=1 Tax=Rhinatrema bivittatum TaxID=194408 RepID=UPI00112703D9|nr:uncharacterized protein C17orf64 homolog [Rhinatrema bivittatum]